MPYSIADDGSPPRLDVGNERLMRVRAPCRCGPKRSPSSAASQAILVASLRKKPCSAPRGPGPPCPMVG